ncbi:hypothetical protein KBTX_02463 [wastewater metagenome]|uniref:Uncharacterized protein n=2 Tax=unclassified sequences TaxID=12908 RepID=A0A5B8RDE2_9ZZZZ|nr:hypothetical protein [Arhodomonas sp. KWT]QEA06133.1 hypothetical protein KBTEX_02463 [uncultured organism]
MRAVRGAPWLREQMEKVVTLPRPRRRFHGWMRPVHGGKAHAVFRVPDGKAGWMLMFACNHASTRSRVVTDEQAPRCRVCLGRVGGDPPRGGAA